MLNQKIGRRNIMFIKLRFTVFAVFLLAAFLFCACTPVTGSFPDESVPTIPNETPETFLFAPSVIRGNGQLSLSWVDKTETVYEVWYGTQGETETKYDGAIVSNDYVSSLVITGLVNGSAYDIVFKNEASNEVIATITETPEELPASISSDFVYILGGFVTGSNAYAMRVTIPDNSLYMDAGKTFIRKGVFVEGRKINIDSFLIAKNECTQQLWYEVQEWGKSNGYSFQNTMSAPDDENKNKPITGINWRDAIIWCNAYSEKSGFDPVYYHNESVLKDSRDSNNIACDNALMRKSENGFRLPKEIEREYAARSGDPAQAAWMYMYAGSNSADDVAWHHGNSPFTIKDTGTKLPNQLGIFDLSGNAQEWGWDWMNYNIDIAADIPLDGSADKNRFNQKPIAGGGVRSNVTMSSAADRWGINTDYSDPYVGFRVVQKR
jgi:formylglycine-generating enzyme required for sulfatase activity